MLSLSLVLSTDTLTRLQEHLQERHQEEDTPVYDDFRLSQLYVHALTPAAIDYTGNELKISLVSTPAATTICLRSKIRRRTRVCYIFKYDRRIGEKHCDRFYFCVYPAATDRSEKFHHFFDYVLMETRRRATWSLLVGVQRSPYARICFGSAIAYQEKLTGPLVSHHKTILSRSQCILLELVSRMKTLTPIPSYTISTNRTCIRIRETPRSFNRFKRLDLLFHRPHRQQCFVACQSTSTLLTL
ncbi:N(6)-adenine-specific DNA methyltransferase 2 [Phytophthora megakarya]|uniref:N(6)-adenine-specific DNA methyltransferase 2 n=1 Tax=Phytophthora megakarya TaxID=4795 RepID=A0A225WJJ2_9STRA|nr:N(6)-adenine-specific DNA methyltransferase 2 [Phytophthora megakarya]